MWRKTQAYSDPAQERAFSTGPRRSARKRRVARRIPARVARDLRRSASLQHSRQTAGATGRILGSVWAPLLAHGFLNGSSFNTIFTY
jgi:hypothetical protein